MTQISKAHFLRGSPKAGPVPTRLTHPAHQEFPIVESSIARLREIEAGGRASNTQRRFIPPGAHAHPIPLSQLILDPRARSTRESNLELAESTYNRMVAELRTKMAEHFPKASEEIDIGFGLEEESDREVIQGTTYRFLDYMAMVIGNFEIQRKFKDLVFSASVQLDRAINEIDMNRQKQIEIFESALMTVEKLEFNANKNPKEMVEDVLNGHFDDFQQLEMNSLNDVQHLLKWIRKLKNQFSDLKEDEQLSDQADADTIGGDQADVEKLLAQFDL